MLRNFERGLGQGYRVFRLIGEDAGAYGQDIGSSIVELLAGLNLHTHVIVGYPGESEKDFSETLRCLRSVRFQRVHVYLYADRPGTPSSPLPEKVSEDVGYERYRRVREMAAAAAIS